MRLPWLASLAGLDALRFGFCTQGKPVSSSRTTFNSPSTASDEAEADNEDR